MPCTLNVNIAFTWLHFMRPQRGNPHEIKRLMCRAERSSAYRRSPAFVVEDGRDHGAIAARPMKFAGPGDQVRIIAERFQLGHRPHHLMRGSVSALPMAFQTNLLA